MTISVTLEESESVLRRWSPCFWTVHGVLIVALVGGLARASVPVGNLPSQARSAEGLVISWKEHRIDDEAKSGIALRGGDGLVLADFNRDGRIDIASVHEDSFHVRIAYGGATAEEWIPGTLASGAEARGAEDVCAGDFNRDGWPDLAVACEAGHLLYLQNPGRTVGKVEWPKTVLAGTQGRGSFIRVHAADLDGDGYPELIAANKGSPGPAPKSISYFQAPSDALQGVWTEKLLLEVKQGINCPAVDIDEDGDLDVLACDQGAQRLTWLLNDGEAGFRPVPLLFTEQLEGIGGLRGFAADFSDFNGDGRTDVVLCGEREALIWIEQPRSYDEAWRMHRIGSTFPDAIAAITVADIDGDGDPDVIVGGYSVDPRDHDSPAITAEHPLGRIAWFENVAGDGTSWRRHDVFRIKRGMYDVLAAYDIDRDGDVDFVGTRGNSGTYDGVFWLEQVRTSEPKPSFQRARDHESEAMPLPEVERGSVN